MAAKAFEMVQEHRDNIIEFPKPVNNKKKGKKSEVYPLEVEDAKKLSKQTGFPFIVPDLKGQKDYSDFYKSLESKEDFRQLELLFH